MPYCCDSSYDEYTNYLSKMSTLCDEIDNPNVFIMGCDGFDARGCLH